ncbi:MAG: ATP-binding cassette domain-containing protein [Candidatus Cloacimonetes bacterium]|nr:ATP-binding cassette domain-containing protein [Candidatus Cloacimonadota bacterium]
MIVVKDLCVSLNQRLILSDVSFNLNDGHNLVILGRSGSGKTVLIKSLLGIYEPDSGSVTIDGIDVHSGSVAQKQELKKRFAMVFQNAALLDSFTVFQNIALPLYEREDFSADSVKDKVVNSLSLVGLENTVDLYPAQLSGGMRKRIGIARALVYDPDYIIFDEPVSGLDPITAKEILYYIAKIIATAKSTVITITHEVSSLSLIGDRVLFLDTGKVIFEGGIAELQQSKDSFLQRYIS